MRQTSGYIVHSCEVDVCNAVEYLEAGPIASDVLKDLDLNE
jgi:hypothetical protein